jgi:hypothetical protein
MALPDRLGQIEVDPPPLDLPAFPPLRERLINFRRGLDVLMSASTEILTEEIEDNLDIKIARARLAEMKEFPDRLVQGDALRRRLDRIES